MRNSTGKKINGYNLLLLLIFFPALLQSQENHYWNQQIGSISSMTGGASTANARDNSAIYYNPGGLAFVENSSLSLTGDAYFLSSLNIENGAGEGINLTSRIVDTTPQIFSGIIKNKKNPDFNITYAILNKSYSFINMRANNEMLYDIFPDLPGDEIYKANYDYYNRLREDWIGIGMGHKLGQNIGIGASVFLAFRSQDFTRSYSTTVIEAIGDPLIANSIAYSSFSELFEHRNLGLVWKFGVNYDLDNLKVGLNITTPKLNIGLLKGNLRRDVITRIPMEDDTSPVYSTSQDKSKTTHRLPMEIDVGIDYIFGKTEISVRGGFSTAIEPYSLIEVNPPKNEIQDILNPNDTVFSTMMDASKRLFNVGIGIIHIINEGWAIIGGYRTDFNYFDDKKLNRQTNYVPSISYWDIHHISGGFTWYGPKYLLSLGFDYGIGRANGIQEINLTEPTSDNYLFGTREDTAAAKYNQIGLNLGFTYLFTR